MNCDEAPLDQTVNELLATPAPDRNATGRPTERHPAVDAVLDCLPEVLGAGPFALPTSRSECISAGPLTGRSRLRTPGRDQGCNTRDNLDPVADSMHRPGRMLLQTHCGLNRV